jgi:hypothetical protein
MFFSFARHQVVDVIMTKLHFVLACGIADDFFSHFTTTQSFVHAFETLCGSLSSVKVLRAHPAFVSLAKRWSFPVYYQLRLPVLMSLDNNSNLSA